MRPKHPWCLFVSPMVLSQWYLFNFKAGSMNLKHPLVVIAFAGIVTYLLYYLMSPYQMCMRDFEGLPEEDKRLYCRSDTTW